MNVSAAIAHYLEKYDLGYCDEAFHGLWELNHLAIPELSKAFHASTDTSRRAFLLRVIRHHRQASDIPLLTDALFDGQPEVWREVMDGLVSLASAESLRALRGARARLSTCDRPDNQFREWLDEAIDQVETQMK